ncbi:hypothetical protein AGLY_011234 [Aphis glycines]|uniref:C2H2-type domain-containing protein n=1 Tax=Aphis glycines TaxID=307491 RepID=A0A6G0TD98_APHGL|nr:hypothetical protein AGLY_011234 [Aphis glycines]
MFKCDKCPSVFKAKRHLMAHKKVHLGIRYPCIICQSSFNYKSNLIRHQKTLHGIVNVSDHRRPAQPTARESDLQFASPVTFSREDIQIAPQIIVPDIPAGVSNMISDGDDYYLLAMDADEILDTNTVKELKLKRENIGDTFWKKCIQKSEQAANKRLRPEMKHRRTESNGIKSEPEKESEVESKIVRNVEDPGVCVNDSGVESPESRQQMSVKRKKMSFEDNLLQMLEGRKVEDPVSSFLMSLAPQIRKLCQEKQNQIFIEFLQTIQRVSSTNPNQTSSSLTSTGLDTNQSVFAAVSAANPHQCFNYDTNLSQTKTVPDSPLTIPLIMTEED